MIFDIHHWKVPWYGIFFALGLAVVWLLMRFAAKYRRDVNADDVDRMMFWMTIGAVLGGRLGEVVLFEPEHYLASPTRIFLISNGGMSFHGGLIGVIIASVVFYHLSSGVEFLRLADITACAAPAGLMLGRFGNFLNGELYGPKTKVPWYPLGDHSVRGFSRLHAVGRTHGARCTPWPS
jgi:phosphatidylglycerol---prolipoprotein diacylglyceryl transferase